MRYFIEIHLPGGGTERHEIAATGALLGSAEHAAIRPDLGEPLPPELCQLKPSAQGCEVVLAPGLGTPLVQAGVALGQALVPWGDELFWGRMRFTLMADASAARGVSSLVLLCAAFGLLAAGWLAFSPTESDVVKREIEPPALTPHVSDCGVPVEQAEARARQSERGAFAKQERFEFDVADGPSALTLFATAAVCYRAAGMSTDAERADAALAKLSSKLDEDYAAARLRLSLALSHQRWPDALSAIAHLQGLTAGSKGPYLDWLVQLRREVERKAQK